MSSDHLGRTATIIYQIGLCALGLLIGVAIGLKLALFYLRRITPLKTGAGAEVDGLSKESLINWYGDALDRITAARIENESSIEFGEPIYLWHSISQGQFRHWALHTHGYGYKCELHQNSDDSDPRERFEVAIVHFSYGREAYEKAPTTIYSGEIGQYFFSMIGWTTLSKEKVDEECRRVWETFGKYAGVSKSCHNFLQTLADNIATTRAPEWDWFQQHSLSSESHVGRPGLGYEVISAATWAKHLEKIKHDSSRAQRGKIEELIVKFDDYTQGNLEQLALTLQP